MSIETIVVISHTGVWGDIVQEFIFVGDELLRFDTPERRADAALVMRRLALEEPRSYAAALQVSELIFGAQLAVLDAMQLLRQASEQETRAARLGRWFATRVWRVRLRVHKLVQERRWS